MAQSTRTRGVLNALRSGGSANLVPAVTPALPRATTAPTLSHEAKRRLRWFDYARTHPPETCRHFAIARSTFYEWNGWYDPHDLTMREDRSSRPKQCRGRE